MHQIATGQPVKQVNTLFLGLRALLLSKCFPEQLDTSTHHIRPGVGLSDTISAGVDHEIKLVEQNQGFGKVWNEGILCMFKNLDRA